MRFRYRALLVVVLAGAALSLTLPVQAAETSNSEFVIIQEEDVFGEDLYAAAINVVIDGTLEGDLVAFAAGEVVINGTVTGSVIAVTPRLTINGEVGESVRVTGNQLRVTGEIGADLVAAVVSAELAPTSTVSGDVLLWAWDARALGSIGGDLSGSQRHLDLAGDIDGDVDVSVSQLTVVDQLGVGGDLGYRSEADAVGFDQATVEGAIVDEDPLPPNLRIRALGLLGRFLVVVFLSLAALSAAYGWPRRTTTAVAAVGSKPVRRWLVGALVLFSPLIVVLVTGLILGLAPATVAFPLLAVLVPVILALVGIVFAVVLVAGAPTAGWIGGVLFSRLDGYGAILAGSMMIGLISFLPYVGWLVPIVVLPIGLGAWIASWSQSSEPVSVDAAASRNA